MFDFQISVPLYSGSIISLSNILSGMAPLTTKMMMINVSVSKVSILFEYEKIKLK